MPPPVGTSVTPSRMLRTLCCCRTLGYAWLRRLKKYLRLSAGLVKRLRKLVASLRRLLLLPRPPPPVSSSARGSATSTGSAAAAGEAGVRGHADEPWCTIAYWELNERVGPLFPVRQPWLHVTFEESAAPPAARGGVAAQDALSLLSLARSKTTPCKEAVARTRAKIGMGVTLLHERDGVWVYNRSEHGVFVTSPTLDGPQVRNLTVFKVPPGYSLRVFDWERARRYCRCPRVASLDGPFDPNAVRISFVKGWGPRYSRQAVTALPCSLELLLRPPAR
ncbi:unnamed protein product [Ixodes pacificus]